MDPVAGQGTGEAVLGNHYNPETGTVSIFRDFMELPRVLYVFQNLQFPDSASCKELSGFIQCIHLR
jgi:hypothetical protein